VAVSGVYRIPASDEFDKMMNDTINILFKSEGKKHLMPTLTKVGNQVNLFRLVFGDDPDVQKKASPLSHVRTGLPPFLVAYAEAEIPGLREMAGEFADALKEADSPAELVHVTRCNHLDILLKLNRPNDPMAEVLMKFIEQNAKKK
jgi:acetyl esterase/lipase